MFASGQPNSGFIHTHLLAQLSLRAAAAKRKATISARDAGDPVAGVTVSVAGKHLQTDAHGLVSLTLRPGSYSASCDRSGLRACVDQVHGPMTPHTQLKLAVLAVAGVALVLAVGAEGSPTEAQAVSCGDTVTQSIKLTADLSCGASDGLDVGADHVRIDLGGHTISGTGPYNGVYANGYQYTTVRNGTIAGFEDAVFLDNAPHGSITGIVARADPGVAIAVQDSPFSAVSKVTVVAYGYEGVYLQTDGSSLTNSSIDAAANPVGTGVVVWGSGDSVSGNTVLASARRASSSSTTAGTR